MTAHNYPMAVVRRNERLGVFMLDWGRGNYWQRRLIRKRQGSPRFLYKYRGFVAEFDKQNLRDTIVHSVIRLSRPTEFNDPFDMHCRFVAAATEQEKLARFTTMVDEQMTHASSAQKQIAVNNLMAESQQALTERFHLSVGGVRQTTGVHCFAGTPRSVLMWSHYADKHRGVCLQFDTSRDFPLLSQAVPVIPVIGEDLPSVNFIVGFKDQILRMLLSKHTGWEYEKERRMIMLDQGGRYLDIRPDSLRTIILGLHVSDESIEFVHGLLAERVAAGLPHVRVLRARAHPTKYRLVFRRSP
jgi:Protein of unknown function (DUF2971)